ncbi:amidase family protein [Duganella rivi]|nr:amidase family protein [Duganella rivi]
MNRRDFVRLGTPPGKQLGTGGILDAGVDEQQRLMEVGKLTSHWLTSQYLTRIKLAGKSGIEIHPHALKLALDMDRERNLKRVRGPLHGIPVLLKEGNEVAAVQLREAGAVLIGKIKQDELADQAVGVLVFQNVAESGLDAHRVQVQDNLFQRSVFQ